MCIARPVKVLKRDGQWLEVEDGHGASMRVWSALLINRGVKAGDYILVHGELAINRLPEDEALRILELVKTLGDHSH